VSDIGLMFLKHRTSERKLINKFNYVRFHVFTAVKLETMTLK
jgi:hypothetical protein